MKLEIIKEEEYDKPTWYFLRVDGKTISCSKSLEEIEQRYEEVKKDPSVINSSRIVLKSEEIIVDL